jgi:hypothetical protein
MRKDRRLRQRTNSVSCSIGWSAERKSASRVTSRPRNGAGQSRVTAFVLMGVAPGSVASALEPLRMARKLDPYRETARIALEPWLVEAALVRPGRKLSGAEQRTIINATRTPHKVRWPEWWTEHP